MLTKQSAHQGESGVRPMQERNGSMWLYWKESVWHRDEQTASDAHQISDKATLHLGTTDVLKYGVRGDDIE
jgi:hypothetical protein